MAPWVNAPVDRALIQRSVRIQVQLGRWFPFVDEQLLIPTFLSHCRVPSILLVPAVSECEASRIANPSKEHIMTKYCIILLSRGLDYVSPSA